MQKCYQSRSHLGVWQIERECYGQKENSEILKISNVILTKKTKQLHENPSKFLLSSRTTAGEKKKDFLKRLPYTETGWACGCISCRFIANYEVLRKRFWNLVFAPSIAKITKSLTAIISRRIFTKSGLISLRKSKRSQSSSCQLIIIFL